MWNFPFTHMQGAMVVNTSGVPQSGGVVHLDTYGTFTYGEDGYGNSEIHSYIRLPVGTYVFQYTGRVTLYATWNLSDPTTASRLFANRGNGSYVDMAGHVSEKTGESSQVLVNTGITYSDADARVEAFVSLSESTGHQTNGEDLTITCPAYSGRFTLHVLHGTCDVQIQVEGAVVPKDVCARYGITEFPRVPVEAHCTIVTARPDDVASAAAFAHPSEAVQIALARAGKIDHSVIKDVFHDNLEVREYYISPYLW